MKFLLKKMLPFWITRNGFKWVTFLAIIGYRLKHKKIIVRKGSTDSYVFGCIFVLGELKLPLKVNPKLIIDAGAYTGLSALYYARTYPKAKIIAIEPEASNFEVLEKNTISFPAISRMKAGLWYKNAFLKVVDENKGNWGFEVKEVSELEDFDIKGVTVDTILKESGMKFIDILKLDIEGSEKELFSNNYQSWLDKVNVLVIELHDRFKSGCSKALYSAINLEDWNQYVAGEKVILIRKQWLYN